MRIAYLSADFGVPVMGTKGASVHVRRLVEALAADGHDVMLLAASLGEGRRDDLPCPAVEIPLEGIREVLYRQIANEPIAKAQHGRLAKDLRNLLYAGWMEAEAWPRLERFAPDVVYERYSLFGFAGVQLARRLGVPLLLEVNAPLVREQAEQRGLALAETARAAERHVFQAADHLLVVSTPLAEHAVAQGVDPSRITVVPNAADPDLFRPREGRSEIRSRLGWEQSYVAGFVGSMKNWHGVATIVQALALLDEPVRGLLVGDGPELPALRALAGELGVSERVHFAGAVPQDDVPDWLAAVDVAVAPYAAGAHDYFSPLKIFEYMAMSRPVVGARTGQVPEVVEEGRTGWLYPPGDHEALAERLRWLSENRPLGEAAGAAGRERVLARHTWRHNAQRIAGIARGLVVA